MTYNLKKIMTRAHEIACQGMGGYRFLFSMALRAAWGEAKAAVRAALETPADKIYAAIRMIENKSRVGVREFARIAALRSELAGLAVAA